MRTDAQVASAADQLGSVDLFATQPLEARQRLAVAARHHLFAAGEAMVRQDAAGNSMFVLLSGQARVALERGDYPAHRPGRGPSLRGSGCCS